jgi:hypothetical protein
MRNDMQHLIVTNDFGDYKRGDRITDQKVIDEIRAGQNASNVVPVVVADESAPDLQTKN